MRAWPRAHAATGFVPAAAQRAGSKTFSADGGLGAHGTIFNVLVNTYMCFTGMGAALCALTGKAIGERSGGAVPQLCALACAISLGMAAAIGALLYVLRSPLARLFTLDADVVHEVSVTMLGASLSVPGYALFMTLFGALRGAGRQALATFGAALGYGVGLPLAYVLGSVLQWPAPLLGCWLGNVAALTIAAVWSVGTVLAVDWRRCAPAHDRRVEPQTEAFLDAPPSLPVADGATRRGLDSPGLTNCTRQHATDRGA